MSFQQQILTYAPPYFRGPRVGVLLEAFGASLDAVADRVWQGRLAAIPYAGDARGLDGRPLQCEPDALRYHAQDRGIQLYPTEPLASRRFRLSRWRQLHARRGTHRGELEHVQPYFLPGVRPTIWIVHQPGTAGRARWHKIDSAGVYSVYHATIPFNYDGRYTKWSRWWAFVDMAGTGIAGPPLYDDGHLYDDGTVYDGSLSAAQCDDIVAMFRDWKAAHSWLAGVILVWPPAVIDPTATPTQDADGRWSLPNGTNTWSVLVDPGTGLATRPLGYQWLLDNPVP